MNHIKLQSQNEKIYSYFKTTTEPFDSLEWDGVRLEVVNDGQIVELYSYDDLKKIIPRFN